jgi:hypothetical protein
MQADAYAGFNRLYEANRKGARSCLDGVPEMTRAQGTMVEKTGIG